MIQNQQSPSDVGLPPIAPRPVTPLTYETGSPADPWRPIRIVSLVGIVVGVFQIMGMLTTVAALVLDGLPSFRGTGLGSLQSIPTVAFQLLNGAAGAGLVIGGIACLQRRDLRRLLVASALVMGVVGVLNYTVTALSFLWGSTGNGSLFALQLAAMMTASFAQYVGFPVLTVVLAWPRRQA